MPRRDSSTGGAVDSWLELSARVPGAVKAAEPHGTVRKNQNLTGRMVIFTAKCAMMFQPVDAGTGSEIDEEACVQACCAGYGRSGRAHGGDGPAGRRRHDRRVAALGLRVIDH